MSNMSCKGLVSKELEKQFVSMKKSITSTMKRTGKLVTVRTVLILMDVF